jgi:hypothetical protein
LEEKHTESPKMRASTTRAMLLSLPLALAASIPFELSPRDTCSSGYTTCSPSGATSTTVPKIGDADFANLFVDIVKSGLVDGNAKRSPDFSISERAASLCCVASLTCMAMSGLNIPFCYDRFTTNFFLPDGSYGTIFGGTYTSSNGDTANLLTGNYTLKSGTTGNIYASNPVAKPNTATLSIPNQFTGIGVGTAIPASALGVGVTVTVTTTQAGSTIAATTISGTTKSATVIQATTVGGSTLAASTVAVTTISPTTVQGTTVTGGPTVYTTDVPGGGSGTTTGADAATSTTKVGGAVKVGTGIGLGGGVAVALGWIVAAL